MVPDSYQQNSYRRFSNYDWQELLGDVPLIYPYAPEAITSFVFDLVALTENKKLNQFTKNLVEKINPLIAKHGSGVLKLMENKSLINWG